MVEKKQKAPFTTGYSKVFSLVNTSFNILLSLLLILCAIPFFLIISLAIKLQDGGPVFYRGVRLGLGKKHFIMYKFRTLVPEAENIIGAELFTKKFASSGGMETAVGTFLRDTRLDELPQLFNILKGDMDFLGPRPERPSIYEKFCKHIKGYDNRFNVKPGLIGYSQLFTPHSSPKRIRSLIDNKFLKKKQFLVWDVFIVCITIVLVLGRIVRHMGRFVRDTLIKSKLLGIYTEHRRLERVRMRSSVVHLGQLSDAGADRRDLARLVDINEEAVLLHLDHEIQYDDIDMEMEITISALHGRRNRKKTALCRGTVYKRIKADKEEPTYAIVVKYVPVSPYNSYIVHQYFLHESII